MYKRQAIGYSGILMAKEIKEDNGKLYTIEIDEERYNLAQENFKKSGLNNIISIKGDALEEVKKIEDRFDFVFIDASKGHYTVSYTHLIGLVSANGANVTLGAGSTVTTGANGIGVYVNTASTAVINDVSKISVGTEGVYLYSNGGNLSFAGNLTVNNQIGIAANGGTVKMCIRDRANSGNISYIGNKGTSIFNLGNFGITGGTISATGLESGVLFNKSGTVNVSAGTVNLNASSGATAIYSSGGTVSSSIGANLKISVDDTSNPVTKGLAIYLSLIHILFRIILDQI